MDLRARFRAHRLWSTCASIAAASEVAAAVPAAGAWQRDIASLPPLGQRRLPQIFLGALLLIAFAATSRAVPPTTITLDGSLGAPGTVTGTNHLFTIAPGMGKSVGANLFQSFGTFNLGTGDVASFGVNAGTQNVIARVTGGSASSIDGTMACPVNLFFLNPAGVMFTSNAQVDVTGSFIVSTASYAKLSDGNIFYADVNHPVADAGLTAAPVSAFGFLSPAPQPVLFTGSTIGAQPTSTVTGIQVIGGNISLNGANLFAPNGVLTLFSAAGTGEVPFSLTPSSTQFSTVANTVSQYGAISLTNGAQAEIDGVGGGIAVIRCGQITMLGDSNITSGNYGAVVGGNIYVQAAQLTLSGGSFIATQSFDTPATADAGSIDVNVAGALEVTGTGSEISSVSETGGNSGDVSVSAGSIDLNGGQIFSVADLGSSGNGGTVTVNAGSLSMEGNARLSSFTAGTGNAGSVNLTLTSGALTMSDTSGIIADTYTSGNGGNITVSAPAINMSGRAVISANTDLSSGNGGNVTIQTGALSIEGTSSPSVTTGITAESLATGAAGVININSTSLSLNNGAVISTLDQFTGNGGSITVNASTVQLAGDSLISAESDNRNGGPVSIMATSSLSLTGGSSISTSAGENGGGITLQVGQLLYLLDSSILAYAGKNPALPISELMTVRGGNINIDPQFVVLDNSLISANDLSGYGHDGNIVNTADFFFTDNSTLHATGTIETTAPDLDLAGSLAFLPANLIDASTRLRESCERATNHEFSTFIVVGRGGIENAPEELQTDFGLSLPPNASGAGETGAR